MSAPSAQNWLVIRTFLKVHVRCWAKARSEAREITVAIRRDLNMEFMLSRFSQRVKSYGRTSSTSPDFATKAEEWDSWNSSFRWPWTTVQNPLSSAVTYGQ